MQFVNDLLYVLEPSRLVLVDPLTGENFLSIPTSFGFGSATVEQEGNLLYIFHSSNRTLTIVDISTPSAPVVRASLSVSIASSDVGLAVENGIVWLSGSGLRSIDARDPDNPVLLQDAETFFTARRFAVDGSGLGLLTPDGGGFVQIYSVVDPNDTGQLLTQFDFNDDVQDVTIANGLGLVATGDQLQVLNFRPTDTNLVAPQVAVDIFAEDLNPQTTELDLLEGSELVIGIQASDDVIVSNAELLINGEVVFVDPSFPFVADWPVPFVSETDDSTFELAVRVTDSGGNVATSSPTQISVVDDIEPPTIVSSTIGTSSSEFEIPDSLFLTFSEPTRVSSEVGLPFRVIASGSDGQFGTDDDREVSASGVFSNRGRDLEIALQEDLLLGTYRVELGSVDLADFAGNVIDDFVPIEFSVGSTPFNQQVDFLLNSASENRFAFTGQAGDRITITAWQFSSLGRPLLLNGEGQLFNSAGELVGESMFGETGLFDLTLPQDGDYYIHLSGTFSFFAGTTSEGFFSISDPETQAFELTPLNVFNGTFEVPGDHQEFSFPVSAGAFYSVSYEGLDLLPVEILNSAGEIIYQTAEGETWLYPVLDVFEDDVYSFRLLTSRIDFFSSSVFSIELTEIETIAVASLPFLQDFESQVSPSAFVIGGGSGIVRSTTSFDPFDGFGHLQFSESQSSAIFVIEGIDNSTPSLNLSFQYRHLHESRNIGGFGTFVDFNEDTPNRTQLPETFTGFANGEGVALSTDGITWHRIADLSAFSEEYSFFEVDLIQETTRLGLIPSQTLRIGYFADASLTRRDRTGFNGLVSTDLNLQYTHLDDLRLSFGSAANRDNNVVIQESVNIIIRPYTQAEEAYAFQREAALLSKDFSPELAGASTVDDGSAQPGQLVASDLQLVVVPTGESTEALDDVFESEVDFFG